jgi:dipeptidase D
MENRKAIVLQGHLDMVHQKIRTLYLILIQGIDMYVDGTVRAHGTTLGADNGLGVAAMAILSTIYASRNRSFVYN